ncbi:MAG: hypothetical protein HYZ33_05055 [Ignavibacteriales bacterium]|nr:hypothetical protein [Ignavibacteriales bacterium]
MGNIWLCRNDSSLLQVVNTSVVRTIKVNDAPASSLVEDNDGDFWCGSANGLVRIINPLSEKPSFSHYIVEHGLPENTIYAALCDREKNLWFLSFIHGLLKLSNKSLTRYPMYSSMDSRNNSNMVADTAGHIWIATGQSLLEFWQDAERHWVQFEHTLQNGTIRYQPYIIQVDNTGALWAGANPEGLLRYTLHTRKNQPTHLQLEPTLPQVNAFRKKLPFTFVIDSSNRLWASFHRLGVTRFDLAHPAGTVRLYTEKDGLPNKDIWVFHVDWQNRIWAGGYLGGAGVFDEPTDRFRTYTTTDGLPDNSVRIIFEDSRRTLWFGTRYGGLAMLKDGVFSTLSQLHGLFSNAVTTLSEDNNGNLWVGTAAGVQSMSLDEPGVFHSNDVLTGAFTYSCIANDNGYLLTTSTEGVTLYDYLHDIIDSVPPPIYITSFTINEKQVHLEGEISLSHNQNNFVVDFVSPTFREEKQLRYRYRLLPSDADWQPAMREHSVAYASLMPGTYTFQVMAIKKAGVQSLLPATLSFTIHPPFWKTWWFILFMIVTAGAVIILFVRFREQQVIALERVRSRIASDLHDDVGSGLTQIALLSEVIQRQVTSKNVSEEVQQTGSQFNAETTSQKIGIIARELVDTMSDVVWSVDPRNDTLEQFLRRIETFATEMCDAAGISCTFDVAMQDRSMKLGIVVLRCMLLVCKEALTNAVRHSHCQNIALKISLQTSPAQIELNIIDDGQGFNMATLPRINGLNNMKTRVEKIGAKFVVSSKRDHGTTVMMNIPL